jgi:hypothetical protein
VTAPRPLVLVIEDGTDYLDRFQRWLGERFTFARVQRLSAALAACTGDAREAHPVGLLVDLDFRRIPAAELVDESARPLDPTLDPGEARRLSAIQGILILRGLRAAGVILPAILFADLDDAGRVRYLEATLAPLAVLPSTEALPAIADRLLRWGAAGRAATG